MILYEVTIPVGHASLGMLIKWPEGIGEKTVGSRRYHRRLERGPQVLQSLATWLVDKMSQHKVIEEEEREYCQYGMEITLANLVNLLIVIVAAIITGNYIGMAAFYLVFIGTRVFCGGYHTEHYYTCFLSFLVIVALGCFVLEWKAISDPEWTLILLFSFLLYGICIYLWAPIENIHKLLTMAEKRRYRAICIGTFPILFLAGILLLLFAPQCGKAVVYAVASVTVLMLLTRMDTQQEEY